MTQNSAYGQSIFVDKKQLKYQCSDQGRMWEKKEGWGKHPLFRKFQLISLQKTQGHTTVYTEHTKEGFCKVCRTPGDSQEWIIKGSDWDNWMKVTYNADMYHCILIFMCIPLQGPQCVTYIVIKPLSSWYSLTPLLWSHSYFSGISRTLYETIWQTWNISIT